MLLPPQPLFWLLQKHFKLALNTNSGGENKLENTAVYIKTESCPIQMLNDLERRTLQTDYDGK